MINPAIEARAIITLLNAQEDLGKDLGGYFATDLLLDNISEIENYEEVAELVRLAERWIAHNIETEKVCPCTHCESMIEPMLGQLLSSDLRAFILRHPMRSP